MDVLGVVHAVVDVKSADGLHVSITELERGDVEVAEETVLVVGLGDDSETLLDSPAEENLCGGLAVGLGNRTDGVVLEEGGKVTVHVELTVRLRAEGGVGSDSDIKGLAKGNEPLLGEVRVELDLEDGGLNTSVTEDVDDQGTLAVAG